MAGKGTIIGISALLIGVSAVGSYSVGVAKTKGDTVTQYLLTQDITVGQSLEGKYQEVQVPKSVSVSVDNLITDESVIKDSIAYTKLFKNQPLTSSVIGYKDSEDRNYDFALPITVEGAIANSLKTEEMVAIKVKFEDERDDAVVVPFIPVREIRTANGAKIEDDKEVPGFLMFLVSEQENIDLNNASKEGALFVVRYNDLNQDKLEKTYVKGKPAETKTEAKPEE